MRLLITILKSFMFWKYRWTVLIGEGYRLHGIATKEFIDLLKNERKNL